MSDRELSLIESYQAKLKEIGEYAKEDCDSRAMKNTLSQSKLATELVFHTWAEFAERIMNHQRYLVAIDSTKDLRALLEKHDLNFNKAIESTQDDADRAILVKQFKAVQLIGRTSLKTEAAYNYFASSLSSLILETTTNLGNRLLRSNTSDQQIHAIREFGMFALSKTPILGDILGAMGSIQSILDDYAGRRAANQELMYWETFTESSMVWSTICQLFSDSYLSWFEELKGREEILPNISSQETLEKRLNEIAHKIRERVSK